MAEMFNGARLVAAGSGAWRPVVWCFHVGGQMDATLRAALPTCAILNYTFNPAPGSAASGKYKSRAQGGGLPSSWAELQETAAHLLPGVQLGRVILSGWSEGCQGARCYLQMGARPAGIVACDGIHASQPPAASQIDPWKAYADLARAGVSWCSITATHIVTSGYLSTTQTLPLVTGFSAADWRPAQGYQVADAGTLHAEHWPGTDAAAHVQQQREVLPRLLASMVGSMGAPSSPPASSPPRSSPPSSTPPRSSPPPASSKSSGSGLGGAMIFGLMMLGASKIRW